jgi:hypothetical protein
MDSELLAERFEADRTRLQAVAYRLLGAASEADDAVQEPGCGGAVPTPAKWRNLSGRLTTVVARVCLVGGSLRPAEKGLP